MDMINLLYVCVQYVLHIPSLGTQVHRLSQKSSTPSPPSGNRELDYIMDSQYFISRSFFGLSREKAVSFECLWVMFSLLVSSSLFLFTSTAHLGISSLGLLWVILVICLLLCIDFHISVSILPWVRFFWKIFMGFFCFFMFFLNTVIQWGASARLWLRIISSYELRNSQKVLQTEFSNMSWYPLAASLFHCWAVMQKISTALFLGKFGYWWAPNSARGG